MSKFAVPLIDLGSIPEQWATVREFADWWCSVGMPFMVPEGAAMFITDNATSVSVFKRGRFQAELYLIHPNTPLPEHGHPGVEVIQMRLDGVDAPRVGNFSVERAAWGECSPTLKDGDWHGHRDFLSGDGGITMIVFERWLNEEPTSAAVAWAGYTVGPIHEALIRRYYPNAFIEPGYADISKPANYRELARSKQ